ncbi:MAG: DUF1353 domain-containing protein [Methylococcales bacterium]|nr:DUF1353 domain-containing protein [Methylococcales bacterium]
MPNRFFDIEGDVSIQLAPWELKKRGKLVNIALFVLKENIRFRSDIAKGVIVVSATNEPSDLASIPKLAWSCFMAPDDPRIELGSWVHDLIYGLEGKITLECGTEIKLTRKQADEILAKEAMPELFAENWRCSIVYQALRKFGKQWSNNSFLERFE